MFGKTIEMIEVCIGRRPKRAQVVLHHGSVVLRKNSRGQRFKPVLVMETAENLFRSTATSLPNVVAN
jgi:hypothetical protein